MSNDKYAEYNKSIIHIIINTKTVNIIYINIVNINDGESKSLLIYFSLRFFVFFKLHMPLIFNIKQLIK